MINTPTLNSNILYIHAGGPKTGSSALQNFFEYNSNTLFNLGYAYEHRLHIKNPFEITSGNGVLLHDVVSSDSTSDTDVDKLILSYFGLCQYAICSSEAFADLKEYGWKKIIESIDRLKLKLKVVFYIRNPIEYFLSAYDQCIKYDGEYRSFAVWMLEADWPHISSLRLLHQLFSVDDLSVIYYDEIKNILIYNFLHEINFPNNQIDNLIINKKMVNRSLTNEEREILCFVNEKFGNIFCGELSRLFISNQPEINSEKMSLNDFSFNYLNDRFQSDFQWINKNYFKKTDVIKLFSDKSHDASSITPDKEYLSSTIKLIINYLLISVNSGNFEQAVRQIIRKLEKSKEIAHDDATNLPFDFDVLHYLLLNPDVFMATDDPVSHYQDHGIREGRRYKI